MNQQTIIAVLAFACALVGASQARAQVNRARGHSGHVVAGPGGVAAGQTHTAVNAGPLGAAGTKSKSGTVVGPGGATVQYGKASGASSGPLGARAGSASGVKVTTPTGQTY